MQSVVRYKTQNHILNQFFLKDKSDVAITLHIADIVPTYAEQLLNMWIWLHKEYVCIICKYCESGSAYLLNTESLTDSVHFIEYVEPNCVLDTGQYMHWLWKVRRSFFTEYAESDCIEYRKTDSAF